MAKGDQVKVLIDAGNGQVIERIFEADAAGREVSFRRDSKGGTIDVEVVGRAGTTVRRAELRADRVIMIEEVPK